MQDADRTAFQPPKPAGTGRSVALALLAHGLLLLALTWGISWKSEPDNLSVTAELWSALPQEAAPPLQEDLQADVVVVGAGFAGLSSAIELAQRV